jgi:hypothetical protein
MVRLPRVAALAAVALIAAACGSADPSGPASSPLASGDGSAACPASPEPAADALRDWEPAAQRPTVIPLLVSSRQVCGHNRFLFSFLRDNLPVAAPDRTVSVAFYDLARDAATPTATAEAEFVWAIENERGLYAVTTTFDESGLWGAEFTTEAPGSPSETIRVQFDVHPDSPTIAIGDEAPASDTPTLDDVGGDISRISTDDEPVPAFYETSVADAVEAGQPFVLVFATPKFCTSAQCGPTLDRMKPVAEAHPGVTFINVEPFVLEVVDGGLQPVLDENNQLKPAPATLEWGLLTEPYLFVVDSEGIVRATFELIAGEAELERVLAEVEAGA